MNFFFFDVELILSVKKGKKVIFEENRLKKFVKKADHPLKKTYLRLFGFHISFNSLLPEAILESEIK